MLREEAQAQAGEAADEIAQEVDLVKEFHTHIDFYKIFFYIFSYKIYLFFSV